MKIVRQGSYKPLPSLEFGPLATPLAEQIKGCVPIEDVTRFDAAHMSANLLWVHNLISRKTYLETLARLKRQIIRCHRQLHPNN